MGCKAMPQRVRGHPFGDLRHIRCRMAGPVELARRHGLEWIAAREQPGGGSRDEDIKNETAGIKAIQPSGPGTVPPLPNAGHLPSAWPVRRRAVVTATVIVDVAPCSGLRRCAECVADQLPA